jgi:hypothetical protein
MVPKRHPAFPAAGNAYDLTRNTMSERRFCANNSALSHVRLEMAREIRLRDPRVELIDPKPRSSDPYLHRAARVALLLAIPVLTQAGDLPKLRSARRSEVSVERPLPSKGSADPAETAPWEDLFRERRR